MKIYRFAVGIIGELKSARDFIFALSVMALSAWAGITLLQAIFSHYPEKICWLGKRESNLFCVENPGFWSWFFASFQILLAVFALVLGVLILVSIAHHGLRRLRR